MLDIYINIVFSHFWHLVSCLKILQDIEAIFMSNVSLNVYMA